MNIQKPEAGNNFFYATANARLHAVLNGPKKAIANSNRYTAFFIFTFLMGGYSFQTGILI